MTQPKPEFVQRFEDAWTEPKTRFVALFHPEGTLFQAGMDAPITREKIPAHQEATLSLLPDMHVVPTHWAESGDDVLIEWETGGTFQGRPISWRGLSRFTLRDGLVIEEVAYFDTTSLRAALTGVASAAPDLVESAIQAIGE